MRIKTVPVGEVKAGPDDGLAEGEFIVYPSTFTREPDSYGDVVAKGAFLDTIQQWKDSGNSLPGLFGHRMDDPDFYVAYALDMDEDEHGWRIHGAFDMESPKGPHVYRLVKGRRLNQLSFAFDTLEEGAVELEDGRKAKELRKLRVHEFSFVPIGANQDTSVVAVKGIVDGLKAGRVLSKANETSLREARDSIDSVLSSLPDEGTPEGDGPSDQDQASGTGKANDEGADGVKSKEPTGAPSARALAAQALDLEVLG